MKRRAMNLQKGNELPESDIEVDAQAIDADVLRFKIQIDEKNHVTQLAKKDLQIEQMENIIDGYKETIGNQTDQINENQRIIKEMKQRESELETQLRNLTEKAKQQKDQSDAVCKAQAEKIKDTEQELLILRDKIHKMEVNRDKTDEKVTLLGQQLEDVKKDMPSQNMMNEMFKMVREIHGSKTKEEVSKPEGHKVHVENVHNLQIGHQATNKSDHHLPPIKTLTLDSSRSKPSPRSPGDSVKGARRK